MLFLLMGEIRSCLIFSNTLIVAPLMTFIAMKYTGLSANLMSLTGLTIAIGLITDGAICVVENTYSRLAHAGKTQAGRFEAVIQASKEVAVPVMFGIAVMILVLMPLLAMQGMEGELFKPLAITLAIGLAASLVLALTVTPALCAYALRGGSEEDKWLMGVIRRPYTPMLTWTLANPLKVVVICSACFFGSLALVATGIGSEVQRPLATVVVYGVITATLLTMLFVLALYKLVEGRAQARRRGGGASNAGVTRGIVAFHRDGRVVAQSGR